MRDCANTILLSVANTDCGMQEEQEEEDYDVIPTGKGAVTPSPSTPTEVMSPARGPMRSSFTGQGHAAPSGGSILHRPGRTLRSPPQNGCATRGTWHTPADAVVRHARTIRSTHASTGG